MKSDTMNPMMACAFLTIAITASAALPESGATTALPQAPAPSSSPAAAPGYLACADKFRELYKAEGRKAPNWYRYGAGKCAPEIELPPNTLYMMIVRPEGSLPPRTHYEQILRLRTGQSSLGDTDVCSDHPDNYAAWLKEKMRQDPRCIGFPGIKSIKPGAPGRPASAYVSEKADMRNAGKPIDGTASCVVLAEGGRERKLITWVTPDATYAINGTARGLAARFGWKDGKNTFNSSQMLEMLQRGQEMCR